MTLREVNHPLWGRSPYRRRLGWVSFTRSFCPQVGQFYALISMIRAKCPDYYLDEEEAGEEPYLMNHCPCGARLDDERQHGDVGAAFSPDTPDGFGQIKLFKLPIAEPIAVECSYTIGGGEYLDFDKAEPW